MIVKVCGMRQWQNIKQVEVACSPDMMGFIFYPRSPRYVDRCPEYLPVSCRRVGVFVNASEDYIIDKITEFGLDYVQLHGDETPDQCRRLRVHAPVIKAIHVSGSTDVDNANRYANVCDFLLFETKCQGYGGSGLSFDWSILEAYQGDTPFLISGGIGPDDADRIKSISHPRFAGVDINSAFEQAPALKDISLLTSFIHQLR